MTSESVVVIASDPLWQQLLVSFAGTAGALVVAWLIYRLTRQDEASRLNSVLEADRKARAEERHATVLREAVEALYKLQDAADTPIRSLDDRDAFTRSVEDYLFGLWPLEAILPGTKGYQVWSDNVLRYVSGWLLLHHETDLEKLNANRSKISIATRTSVGAFRAEWFSRFASDKQITPGNQGN